MGISKKTRRYKGLLLLGILALLVLCCGAACAAEGDVTINETNFPDANFRAWVSANIANTNGVISKATIAKVKKLDCANKSIASLVGVEHFTAVEWLYCNGNSLTTLDLTKNPEITEIFCNNNKLTSINLTKNTKLEELIAFSNALTTIDLTHCPVAHLLSLGSNKLTTIDVSKNPLLDLFWISSNKLTALNVSANPKLASLSVGYNNLSSLNVSANPELDSLSCNSNSSLASLDLSANSLLTSLECGYCRINTLILPQSGTALQSLTCYNNSLRSLNVSRFVNLEKLDCGRNYLTTLDVTANTKLTELDASTNSLTALDVTKNTKLTNLNVASNLSLASLDLTNCPALSVLDVSQTSLPSLDLSRNTALKELDCSFRNLGTLSLTANTALEKLRCVSCGLQTLDLSHLTKLTTVDCSTNSLTVLDTSACVMLEKLQCNDNMLVQLDLARNAALTSLRCESNRLTGLNLSANTKLTSLYCYRNRMTSLNLSANTKITSASVYSQSVPTQIIGGTAGAWTFDMSLLKDPNLNLSKVAITSSNATLDTTTGIVTFAQATTPSKLLYNYQTDNADAGTMDVTVALSNSYPIDADSFPDEKLRAFLLAQPYGADGKLTVAELATIESMDASGQGIQDLTGIRIFSALKTLNCANNALRIAGDLPQSLTTLNAAGQSVSATLRQVSLDAYSGSVAFSAAPTFTQATANYADGLLGVSDIRAAFVSYTMPTNRAGMSVSGSIIPDRECTVPLYPTEKLVTLPSDTTSVARSAFANNAMSAVALNARLTTIGAKAFASCPKLVRVYAFGTSVTSCAADAFSGCAAPLVFYVSGADTDVMTQFARTNGHIVVRVVR